MSLIRSKNDDFGTNLLTGKYKDSMLGQTFQQLIEVVEKSRQNNEDYTPLWFQISLKATVNKSFG